MAGRVLYFQISPFASKLAIAPILVLVRGLPASLVQNVHTATFQHSNSNWPLAPEQERKVNASLKQMTVEEKTFAVTQ
jgi:hypothetical protein